MDKKNIYTTLTLLIFVANGLLVAGVSIQQDLSLSLREKQALDKFRHLVQPLLRHDYMKTDIYLIRWLRAKNFNVREAEEMLKEDIRWRRDNKMDKIQFEDFTDMVEDLPSTVDTYDKEGRPIGVVDFFNWDIRGTILAGKGARALRYLDWRMNNLTMQVFERQRKGMQVSQWKIIGNGEGFNMVTHGCPICIPYWIRFLNTLENHFPGWLDELVIIEAPPTVYTLLEMLRHLLSRQTSEALRIFGSNKKQWQAYLDKSVSRSERRAPYGGTKPPVGKLE